MRSTPQSCRMSRSQTPRPPTEPAADFVLPSQPAAGGPCLVGGHRSVSPKLRDLGSVKPRRELGLHGCGGLVAWVGSGYVRVRGTLVSSSSQARRWVGVGMVRVGTTGLSRTGGVWSV